MSWPNDLHALLKRYYANKERLESWGGVIARQSLEDHQDEQRKNQEAEGSAVRKKLWDWGGDKKSSSTNEDDGMGSRNTHLGDITHPTPVVIPPQQSMIPAIVLAALTGAGGYWLATKDKPGSTGEAPLPITFDDETVSVGLKRIGDIKQTQKPGN